MAIKTLAIIAAEIACCMFLNRMCKLQAKADEKHQAAEWAIIDGEFILFDDPLEDIQ